jgi:hypothetical protein
MCSFIGGTNSGFESISPFRLYLDLSNGDKEFSSGLEPISFINDNTLGHYDFNNVKDFKPDLYKSNIEYIVETKNEFADILRWFHLGEMLVSDFEYTLFLPLDISDFKKMIINGTFTAKDILKAHLVNYPIIPYQLIDRKNRIDTKLEGHFIFTNSFSIMNSDFSSVNAGSGSNKILESVKTDNGYIYVIEKTIIPYAIRI